MKHYGDITKLNGAELPMVDIICGGSPCQDLSVAGLRKGFQGERSSLFLDQIRIIKEMRNECIRQLQMRGANVDRGCVRPRYMVWENVPGAFSSGTPKGEDFRIVLEETAKVCDQNAVIPRPANGKWTPSGCIMGNGWSIAWRVHDAQFWGVPQRRKRISLVADFGGTSAPEILFEREGVSGNTEQSEQTGKETSGAVGTGADSSSKRCSNIGGNRTDGSEEWRSYTLEIRGGVDVDSCGKKAGKGPLVQTELSGTLGVSQDQTLITNTNVNCLNSWDVQSKHIQPEDGKAEALYSGECRYGGGGQRMPDKENFNAVVQSLETYHCTTEEDKVQTLKARDYKDPQVVSYGLDRASFNQGQNALYDFSVEEEKAQTLVSRGPGGVLTKQ